ncbi:MAG TPA: UDP-N-acetylglucosamine--N-acetylmuramyl-(pentapeptide) pyrophosphoryl-undecaprenol N-acetylglucosamine transferase [Rhabdochlamydiaceae bacterium]|jgi:UDP-N-acetylglucosamine--N-acetylmuramyl-(pentapeptide) pyrophosphoryl-undecaprenol N-acetylglucosamine transferase
MKKILLAVGGTGGHVFPAQALAHELLECDPTCEIVFSGAHLGSNRFLDKERFRFIEVKSATPFKSNPLSAGFTLFQGIFQSLSLIEREKPAFVVGFGSYHSFPLLAAARWKKIPLVLFEADAIPGKVNRHFSSYALFTGVFFPQAGEHLKGKSISVHMPCRHQSAFNDLTQEQARAFLGLDPKRFTLLVFGGSQGAKGINLHICELLRLLKGAHFCFQLIHLTGDEQTSAVIRQLCVKEEIPCYIREFEPRMGYLWKAASLSLARAGASTLNEMLLFEVPAILIPYPHGSDAHQHRNAAFMEKEVKGAICLLEENATPDILCAQVIACARQIEPLKHALCHYKQAQDRKTLIAAIHEYWK